MKLKMWIKRTRTIELKKLAKMCGCQSNYIYQIAGKGCSAGLAKKIQKNTEKLTPKKVVYKWELRPDIWLKGE